MGFLDKITGRSKTINKAVDDEPAVSPKPSPKSSVTVTVDLSGVPAHKGEKWDDYKQSYVPEKDWKSPQQHAAEEDAEKAKESNGFKKMKGSGK